ncbi:unnamed protein product [Lathyrus oleraceus]
MPRNMALTVKFVYVIVLFISISFVAPNIGVPIKCSGDHDCPKNWCPLSMKHKCKSGYCKCVKMTVLRDSVPT